jgi:hypothetical protein
MTSVDLHVVDIDTLEGMDIHFHVMSQGPTKYERWTADHCHSGFIDGKEVKTGPPILVSRKTGEVECQP